MRDSEATHELFSKALELHAGGQTEEALHLARRVIAFDPEHSDAFYFQGVLALDARSFEEAVTLLERACELAPGRAIHHTKHGVALYRVGRNSEAVAALVRALRLEPDSVEASFLLGRALVALKKFESASRCFVRVLEREPNLAEVHLSQALARRGCGDSQGAIFHAERAVELRPEWAEAYADLGALLLERYETDRAARFLRRALELAPTLASAHLNLGNALRQAGLLAEATRSYERAIELEPDSRIARQNLAFLGSFDPDRDEQSLLALARDCWTGIATNAERFERRAEQSPERRLRIGYVSPDFRNHPIAFVTLPLFKNHDRSAFEVHCYTSGESADAVTRELGRHADGWRSLLGLDSISAARAIHSDGIDILVDLALHTSGNRLDVFAYKPAPVQACWIGYPGTSGLDTIDYRITDPHLDPPERDAAAYSEISMHLPDCTWCYDPIVVGPEVSALPAQETGSITFASLNHLGKVNPLVLALWARVLRAVAGSRLMLLSPSREAQVSLRAALAGGGVEADRVTFVERASRTEHLARHLHVDVALDVFPYTGHVTSLDAFFMGVPVVTLVGQTAVGRAGLGFARNLGLDELVAFTPDEYVERAVELVRDLGHLAELRAGLRERMLRSPLMDGPRFARNMEALYRTMWRRSCERGILDRMES